MLPLLLSIELVPQTAWYTNVRSHVSQKTWDVIRSKCYAQANYVCELCGDVGQNQGVRHSVECHEIWAYDNTKHTQTLTGLIALCPRCHKTKHVGLAQLKGEEEIVIKQLMKLNNMARHEAITYIKQSFEIWRNRSQFEWLLDIEYLQSYCLL